MDAKTLYRCKELDVAVRLIPSDSEDSELESDSGEESTPESDLRESLKIKIQSAIQLCVCLCVCMHQQVKRGI